MTGAASFARADVRALPLYSPDAGECAVDVSDNTNLWGCAPAAARALAAPEVATLSRYPSLYSAQLRDALLRYVGLGDVADAGVVCGCGSDDVLDSAMRVFATPGARIAFATPTFTMIPAFARLNGLETVAIPMTAGLGIDAEQIVDAGAAITYLCTPNNPTGSALARETVEYVAAHARGIVIIDQAYAEFAPDTFDDLVARHPRVLVTRTFSKAFGLAGLRVGYGVGSRELAGLVERARGPYKVNAMAERAAVASLGEGDDALGWVGRTATLAVEVRERLAGELRGLGLSPLPSAGNFLFVPAAGAQVIASRLRTGGVLVRAMSGLPMEVPELGAEDGMGLRLGVGPWDQMSVLLQQLREAMR